MMKVVTIIGARPQFIKAAVVSRVFKSSKVVEEIIVHTGQHFDVNMSEVFFDEMQIPKPNYNLNVNSMGHGAMTGRMLEKIEEVLLKERPDWVLVYGDTNSTLAGALAARKLHKKVAHVEAGLRSFNMDMPEEINRILTDRMSHILFCPTDKAVENLVNEGYAEMNCKIVKNGDVMQDAALFYADKCIPPEGVCFDQFILCTVHRAENTDHPDRLVSIFKALEELAGKYNVVLPLHPRTRVKLAEVGYDLKRSAIHFISPVGYLEMVWLLKNCALVMTDSGGVQKEAYFFGKYCVTMRNETEWVELIENGFNYLVGSDCELIVKTALSVLDKPSADFAHRLYGNGHAGSEILQNLLSYSI